MYHNNNESNRARIVRILYEKAQGQIDAEMVRSIANTIDPRCQYKIFAFSEPNEFLKRLRLKNDHDLRTYGDVVHGNVVCGDAKKAPYVDPEEQAAVIKHCTSRRFGPISDEILMYVPQMS